MLLILSLGLLFLAAPFLGSGSGVGMLFVSQLLLLVDQIRRGQVSGVGGFVFMSVLFFGVRPLYIMLHSDYALFDGLFRIDVDLREVGEGMWWATFALVAFCVGAYLRHGTGPVAKAGNQRDPTLWVASDRMAQMLLLLQILSLPVMMRLAGAGMSLYGSSLGAYAYDLPVLLQSGHVFAFIVILERYLRSRSGEKLILLCLSGAIFLVFTWLMREVSMFRGFYIAGVMIAGIAAMSRIKGRVGLLWIVIPVLLLQPPFRTLGQLRYADNEAIREVGFLEKTFGEDSILGSYWHFYDSKGDMNIFDTFVAAKASEPDVRPYALSWIYPPAHFVPRKFWASKPEKGILQDLDFMNGAPYAPGIAGFFLLDGGKWWMIGSMMLLGYLVAWGDLRVLTMKPGYLRACLIGILSINAMFLTRFFLWQSFAQVIYSVVPCLLLAYFFRRHHVRVRQRPARVPGHPALGPIYRGGPPPSRPGPLAPRPPRPH